MKEKQGKLGMIVVVFVGYRLKKLYDVDLQI